MSHTLRNRIKYLERIRPVREPPDKDWMRDWLTDKDTEVFASASAQLAGDPEALEDARGGVWSFPVPEHLQASVIQMADTIAACEKLLEEHGYYERLAVESKSPGC